MSGLTIQHNTTAVSSATRRPNLPRPRRASLAFSSRVSEAGECPSSFAQSELSFQTRTPSSPRSLSPVRPPVIKKSNMHSWRTETKAKLERVLSRGPPPVHRFTQIADSTTNSEDPDMMDEDLYSLPNRGFSRSQSLSSERRSCLGHFRDASGGDFINQRAYLKKRQSGFMFDPDESDEKKQLSAKQFAQGVKELQLKSVGISQ
eukprot:Gregarina_sp_Poly_1__10803@NODE_831_length_6095_cov_272_214167_g601_i0_p4_GENE_NODE_831_length_6095_cov_272_214167_g601_i0NODE_831_length_6095_cov_272_214167_g601_i0_p4_ORF_typecomplete_len204_score24_28_NODE_831_length_6095_cov_272_214167_g601_i030473658